MADTNMLLCDGCGQFAPPAHIARRLQRLEWATRYRPVHIQTLLIGGIRTLTTKFFPLCRQRTGLWRSQTTSSGGRNFYRREEPRPVSQRIPKAWPALIHVLDCPLEGSLSPSEVQGLLDRQLASTLVRVRRSLKPKRVLLFSKELAGLAPKITEAAADCQILSDKGMPFDLDEAADSSRFTAFRQALRASFRYRNSTLRDVRH